MKRFQFMAATALVVFLTATPGHAADVIMLPGTGSGDGGGASTPRQVHTTAAVGGALGAGMGVGRRAAVGDGAGAGTVDALVAGGVLTRSQAATFRAGLRRIALAQATGRYDQVVRARASFRNIVERFVRNGVLSPGAAQQLLEAA